MQLALLHGSILHSSTLIKAWMRPAPVLADASRPQFSPNSCLSSPRPDRARRKRQCCLSRRRWGRHL